MSTPTPEDAIVRARIRDRRTQYETAGLDVDDLAPGPIEQWHRWHDEAFEAGVAEPNAMTLGTVDAAGHPDGRVVLVRGVDHRGFVFFTNYDSAKSRQLAANPLVSAVFAWLDLHRQVRVRGRVEHLPDAESDAYFASRPRDSQVGAWASSQSEVLTDRAELEQLVADAARRFEGREVPRPPFWGGWLLVPTEIEFWQGRPNRLHDRLRYRRLDLAERRTTGDVAADPDAWLLERLAP